MGFASIRINFRRVAVNGNDHRIDQCLLTNKVHTSFQRGQLMLMQRPRPPNFGQFADDIAAARHDFPEADLDQQDLDDLWQQAKRQETIEALEGP